MRGAVDAAHAREDNRAALGPLSESGASRRGHEITTWPRRSLAALTVALVLAGAGPASATTFPVTNNGDTGPGTLRAAIAAANTGCPSSPSADTISFSGLPANEGKITLTTTQLPQICRAKLTIDGTTFSGGRIVLDGSGLPGGSVGVGFGGYVGGNDGGTLKGFEIGGFSGAGVDVEAAGVTIAGNLIGNDGATATPNGVGVRINEQNDTIGGTTPSTANVISGNAGPGVSVLGPYSYAASIEGNVIGLNAAQNAALANAGGGVLVSGGQSNRIGSGDLGGGGGNVIAGNGLFGIRIASGSGIDDVQGDYVGVNAAGRTFSQPIGVDVQSSYNNIGNKFGTVSGNDIAGNGTGVVVEGSGTTGNTIAGNLIGYAPNGRSLLGNATAGVSFGASTSGNTVGGPTGPNRIAYMAGESGVVIGSTHNAASQNSGSGDPSKWIVSAAPAPVVTNLGHGMFKVSLTGATPNHDYAFELYTDDNESYVSTVRGTTDGSGDLSSTDAITVPPGGRACATAVGGGGTSGLGCGPVSAPGPTPDFRIRMTEVSKATSPEATARTHFYGLFGRVAMELTITDDGTAPGRAYIRVTFSFHRNGKLDFPEYAPDTRAQEVFGQLGPGGPPGGQISNPHCPQSRNHPGFLDLKPGQSLSILCALLFRYPPVPGAGLVVVGFVTPSDNPGYDDDSRTDNTTFGHDIAVVPAGDARIGQYSFRSRAWELTGSSSPGSGHSGDAGVSDRVDRVQLAVVFTGGARAARAGPCRWLAGTGGRLVRSRARGGACGTPVWLGAKLAADGRSWAYRLTRALPRGCFTAYARSFDRYGITQVHFTARLGNRRTFCSR